jgi:hypothetical protein
LASQVVLDCLLGTMGVGSPRRLRAHRVIPAVRLNRILGETAISGPDRSMPIDQEEQTGRLLPMAWMCAAVGALAIVGIIQQGLLPANGDASWYLYMAGRVLDGARPYEDVVDTNPPLIVLVSIVVVAAARVVSVSPLFLFPAILLALSGVSLALSWRLGRGLPLALRQGSLIAWAFLLFVQVGGIFGQREHLLLILILPYAYAAAARCESTPRGLAWTCGLAAGVGFALKPFFVLPALAVEGYLAIRRGPRVWLQPRALAIAVVFALYGVTLLAWTPNYFAVARRFAPLYPYHLPLGPVLWASSWRLGVIVPAIVAAWVLARRQAPEWARVFGLLAVGTVAAVYLTGKGWRYHWYPATSLAVALLAGSVSLFAARWPLERRQARMILVVAVVLPCLCFTTITEWRSISWRDPVALKLVHNQVGERDSMLVFSPWVHRSFPLVNETGAKWGMRHPMLWQIAAFHAGRPWIKGDYHRLESMSDPERRFVGEVVDDFARNRPVLLLVDNDPPTPKLKGFNYLEYFKNEPRFAKIMTDYQLVARTPCYRIYRLADWARAARTTAVAAAGTAR